MISGKEGVVDLDTSIWDRCKKWMDDRRQSQRRSRIHAQRLSMVMAYLIYDMDATLHSVVL